MDNAAAVSNVLKLAVQVLIKFTTDTGSSLVVTVEPDRLGAQATLGRFSGGIIPGISPVATYPGEYQRICLLFLLAKRRALRVA